MIKTILMIFLVSINPAIACAAGKQEAVPVSIKDLQGREVALYKGSHALLIGVSDYTNGWPDLTSIPGEVAKIEVALRQNGFIVEKVMNPDSSHLKNSFETFIDRYGYDKNNRLLFFFSGHGYSRYEGKKGYLVPADAPDPRKKEKEFLQKALAMTEVLALSRKMEAKHALFLFDSCFSGSIFKTKALPKHPPHISIYTDKPVRQFISAGSEDEEIPAISVFAPSFIRALRGDGDLNKDGYITGTELGMHLTEKVLSYNTMQTPQYGKIRDPDLDEGDFVFELNVAPKPEPTIEPTDNPNEITEKDILTVTVDGSGRSESIARGNAFQEAVRKALGTYVSGKTEKDDINRLQDEIVPYSEQYIVHSEIRKEWYDREGLKLKIKAAVSLNKLKEDIRFILLHGHSPYELKPGETTKPKPCESSVNPVIGFVLTAWESFGIGDKDRRPLKSQVLIDSFQEQFKDKSFDIKVLDKAREYVSTNVRQDVNPDAQDERIRKTILELAEEANVNYIARGEFEANFKGVDEATGNIGWGGIVKCEIIDTSTYEGIAFYTDTVFKLFPEKIEGLYALMHSASKNAAKKLAGQTWNTWLKQIEQGIPYNIIVENITSSERRKLKKVLNKVCNVRRENFDSKNKVMKLDILFECSIDELETLIINDENIKGFKNFETKSLSGNSIIFHFNNNIGQP